MDKYEYKLRLEEIRTLNRKGRFQEAAQVADTIDWNKVRNVSTLGVISDVYKINRRFDDAKAILLLANEKSPQNRRIVYALCDLTVKMGQVVDAVEYYKEFVQLAPNDNSKYILLYKIYEAQDISLEERIAVLKEYKKREYNEKWAYEIIESVLDSFMACIANNKLEIKINEQVINHDTLWSVISNQLYINPKKQAMFVAQYKLLKGDGDVRVFDIDTGYGVAKLSVLVLNDNDKRLATHKCAMIRYPYMKIKDFSLQSNLNVAAMCIIENDKLCSTLRDLENPQHSNWEVKRANTQDRQAMRDLINSIKDQISDNVLSCFQAEAHDMIDPYGAGDYLAETNGEESEPNGNATVNGNQEEIEVTKPKEAIVIEKNAYIEQNDGAGVRPEIGQSDSDGDDTSHPGGHNEGSGGGYGEGDELGGSKDGDNIVMKKAPIAGVRYRVIALDKDKGKYRITFTAPDTYEACYISLYIVGDEFKQKDKLSIKNMKCNGVKIASDSEFQYGPFAMKTGQKVIAELTTNQTEYFSCEVKIYATQK